MTEFDHNNQTGCSNAGRKACIIFAALIVIIAAGLKVGSGYRSTYVAGRVYCHHRRVTPMFWFKVQGHVQRFGPRPQSC